MGVVLGETLRDQGQDGATGICGWLDSHIVTDRFFGIWVRRAGLMTKLGEGKGTVDERMHLTAARPRPKPRPDRRW